MIINNNLFFKEKFYYLILLNFCCFSINAETFTEANVHWVYEDNISNAQLRSDIIADSNINISISHGEFKDFDDGLSLTMTATIDFVSFNQLTNLDHVDLSGRFELNKKLGLGHWVPTIGTVFNITQQNSATRVRDLQNTDLSIFWKKRLNEDWDIRTELGIFESTADHVSADNLITPLSQASFLMAADVFDNQAYYFGVNSGFTVSDYYFLEFNYQFRSGDVVSTAAPNPLIRNAADALVTDTAFGTNSVAYKLDADSQIFSTSLSMEINSNFSLSADYQYRTTEANQGIDYDNNRVSLQFFYQF